jgi:hypothetical protein
VTAVTTIKLGGQEFTISPLTVGQSRDLRIGDATIPPDDGAGGWNNIYEVCIRTIAIAIRESHPEVTEEALWKLPASENEIAEARKAILVFAGFRSPEPSIAELRSIVGAKKAELEALQQTLAAREERAKVTGEE